MKILSARFKNFKRLRNSNIKEIFLRFVSPSIIIVGANSSGKSSILRELCPLPAIRTDFEQHVGLKELIIEHKGHQFQLISDFSSRVSPHHFIMDNTELNLGGTTEIQTQLVEKHFGITPAIRDLIYQKVQVCNLQKAQRKNLFLNINPLELGLILETHKKALARVKDCKANLQHLYTRKADLEGKLLKPEILEQHKKTKQEMSDELIAIDKVIYALEQHVNHLRDKYREDLEYKKTCSDNNQILIPVQDILTSCKSVMSQVHRYTSVARGDTYIQNREKMSVEMGTLDRRQQDIEKAIRDLSDEVNEYQKHLESAEGKSVHSLEKELKDLEEMLKKYEKVPEFPIPTTQIEQAQRTIDKIRSLCFLFRDLEVSMLPIQEINEMIFKEQQLKLSTASLNSQYTKLKESTDEIHEEIEQMKKTAGIPDNCSSIKCGLRLDYKIREEKLNRQYKHNTVELSKLDKQLKEQQKQLRELQDKLGPYIKSDTINKFQELSRLLDNPYFLSVHTWTEDLLTWLNQQPLKIVADLENYLEGSILAHEKQQYLDKKHQLTTELQALLKSAGASRDFLLKQIKSKEETIKQHLQELAKIEQRSTELKEEFALYVEYAEKLQRIQEWEKIFTKGEKALMVSKAIDYWCQLGRYFVDAKKQISEELRKIETIVRDQEVITATYNNEIIVHIGKIEEDKKTYEHIEMALSPTAGMPHKSMVKYLNAMISNVNYFVSQVWTTKLKLMNISAEQPLDYNFRIEIGHDAAPDINNLSSGQTEILNFAWTMTILLQLKMLNQIPFFADELGRTLDPTHRQKLLIFLNNAVSSGLMEQLFLVNHYAAMITGFTEADVVCLESSNIPELPHNTNENVEITYY